MLEVISGCPYCGSTKGFEQKETVTRHLWFDSNGEPDGASDDTMIESCSWKYPRCIACGKKVKIKNHRSKHPYWE